MDPKFQSSFIPKGSPTSTGGTSYASTNFASGRPLKEGNLFSFMATIIFALSFLAALGLLGYTYYLNYSINRMKAELVAARDNLEPEVINELIRLDSRLNFARDLITNHQIVTPLFAFLSASTPVTVRFKDFNLSHTEKGVVLRLQGEARGYGALALQADIFNKQKFFNNATFSDFNLSEKGDVVFSFQATVDPSLLSYENSIAHSTLPATATTSLPIEAGTTTPTN